MSARFRFPSARPYDELGFAWSPLFEAVLSLRVVVQPKRTPLHLPWVRRCRTLPTDLQDEIRTLVRPLDRFVPGLFEVGLLGDSPGFADELAAFRALDDDLVAYELSLAFGGIECAEHDEHGPDAIHDRSYRQRVLAGVDDERRALVTATFDDPAAVRDRYVRLLERYWDAAFADEWERLLPRIEAEATTGARALVTAGAAGVVAELLPEARWDPAEATIVVDKEWEGSCDVADRGGLLLVPTVYGWPCVLIEVAEPWRAAIVFPLRELRTPEVPHASDHEVVDGFRALGDETRLQIARLVAEDPRSTKELAQLLSLSDSAVSRHLKILQAAGLVTAHRDGYFVLYRLEPDRLDVLGGALRGTLGLQRRSSGAVPALPVAMPRAR